MPYGAIYVCHRAVYTSPMTLPLNVIYGYSYMVYKAAYSLRLYVIVFETV